jgi:hypothetical protein
MTLKNKTLEHKAQALPQRGGIRPQEFNLWPVARKHYLQPQALFSLPLLRPLGPE